MLRKDNSGSVGETRNSKNDTHISADSGEDGRIYGYGELMRSVKNGHRNIDYGQRSKTMSEKEQFQGKITVKQCIENVFLILFFSLPLIIFERNNIVLLILCILPALIYLISILSLKNGKEIEEPQCKLHMGIFSGCLSFLFALNGLAILFHLFSGKEKFWVICFVCASYIPVIMLWRTILRYNMKEKKHSSVKKTIGISFFTLCGIAGMLFARTFLKNIDNKTGWVIICVCCFLLSYLSIGGIFNILKYHYIKNHQDVHDKCDV